MGYTLFCLLVWSLDVRDYRINNTKYNLFSACLSGTCAILYLITFLAGTTVSAFLFGLAVLELAVVTLRVYF